MKSKSLSRFGSFVSGAVSVVLPPGLEKNSRDPQLFASQRSDEVLPFEDLRNWHWFMFPRSTEAVHMILTGFQVCSCGLPQDHWNEQFHHVTSLGRIWSSFQQGVGNEKPTTMIRWLGGLPLARAGANIACRLKHRISLSMVSRWPLNLKFWWEAWLFYFVWYSLESRDRRIMWPSTCLYIYLILDIQISYMYDYVWIYLCKDIVYIYISHLYR